MFSKGKGLLGMSSRPKRRACRVSLNYDDNHLWEDSASFVGEKLRIHTTRWQDPRVLQQWGMEEDFNSFATATGFLTFAQNPQDTYEELSREFLSTFRFEGPETHKHKNKSKAHSPTFVCKFSMKGEHLVMSQDEFCNAIGVANTGSWEETGADSNPELVNF